VVLGALLSTAVVAVAAFIQQRLFQYQVAMLDRICLFHPSTGHLLPFQNLCHLQAHQVAAGFTPSSPFVTFPAPLIATFFSPLHEAGLVESDHTQEKTLANRDSFGRMSPVTASASADDHFGMNVSASQAFRDVDSNRGRIMQLEQQLRDSLAIEERLKRQLDDAKVRARHPNRRRQLDTLAATEYHNNAFV
jgi:hypothetical protein